MDEIQKALMVELFEVIEQQQALLGILISNEDCRITQAFERLAQKTESTKQKIIDTQGSTVNEYLTH